jgi:uncharacterized protein YcgI (DUF1989 family)
MSSNGAERLKNRKPIKKPVPAYLPAPGSALTVDKAIYTAIRDAPRELIEEFTLPIRSGKAWKAPAGSIVKISTPEGPQVGKDIYIAVAMGASSATVGISHLHITRRLEYLERP